VQHVRRGLAALAILYLAALVDDDWVPEPIKFFVDATALFPHADAYATEYRLEGYPCTRKRWELLDPGDYFPMHADDKESRFQRLAYFYHRNRTVMWALDDYVVAHADEPLGGIRVFEVVRPIPAPGTAFARYAFQPLEPVARPERRDVYRTVGHCNAHDFGAGLCTPDRTLGARCK